jgi:hypothetical protein
MIVPGHVVVGSLEQPGFVFLKHARIVERIDPIELASMNEAHEQVPDVGAMFGLKEVGILSMQDGLFDSLFAKIVVQWRSRHSEEQGQGLPVLEHICESGTFL